MLTPPALKLEKACIQFGALRAIQDVNLTVQPGERIAIIGPSGAGKSSVIGLLNGTVPPSAGRVRVLGCDLTKASSRSIRAVQRRLGTIHQQFDLVDQLRTVHNVNAGRIGSWPFWKAALSLFFPRDVETVREALDRVGIADKIFERTGDLSGGEQQRVAIARVLVQEPAAILADEPIASLDPARGKEIINLLHDISVETGTTLLASLHDVEIALDRFERVIGLRQGCVMFDLPPEQVGKEDITGLYALEDKGPRR